MPTMQTAAHGCFLAEIGLHHGASELSLTTGAYSACYTASTSKCRRPVKIVELKVNFLLAFKMLTYSQGLLLGKLAKRRVIQSG